MPGCLIKKCDEDKIIEEDNIASKTLYIIAILYFTYGIFALFYPKYKYKKCHKNA
jgi:hypothetical protein